MRQLVCARRSRLVGLDRRLSIYMKKVNWVVRVFVYQLIVYFRCMYVLLHDDDFLQLDLDLSPQVAATPHAIGGVEFVYLFMTRVYLFLDQHKQRVNWVVQHTP